MATEDTWVEPTSVEKARERRLELVNEIEEIQAQLGDPLKREGRNKADYLKWRRGAKWALTGRLKDLRRLNHWLDEND